MSSKTIGIIGGGQLGRMLAMAAARLGFQTIILEPQAGCPAAQVANRQIVAAYDNADALKELAAACDVITYEFENVPVSAAETLAASLPVFPPPRALSVSQDRLTEKRFINDCGIATAGFRAIDSQQQLEAALAEFGGKGVLKTRRFGYDGKGQHVFRGPQDSAEGVFDALGGADLILESFVAFEREISIIAARFADGSVHCYDPAENVHLKGILHTSTLPAAISDELGAQARKAAGQILSALDYIGVIGIEFFVTGETLVANEIAPRVHNTGHWTEAACVVSQFEQHIRAVAGLAPGNTHRHSNCVMTNLIGDDIDSVPAWLSTPDVMVHLYGKAEARPGRKMGHVTALETTAKAPVSGQITA